MYVLFVYKIQAKDIEASSFLFGSKVPGGCLRDVKGLRFSKGLKVKGVKISKPRFKILDKEI